MTPEANPPITSFEILQSMENGRIGGEYSEGHRACVAHLMLKGGKPKMTLTVEYRRSGEGIDMIADIVVKLPAKARRGEFLYADEHGRTFTKDPNQTEFHFMPEQRLNIVKPQAVGQ